MTDHPEGQDPCPELDAIKEMGGCSFMLHSGTWWAWIHPGLYVKADTLEDAIQSLRARWTPAERAKFRTTEPVDGSET